MVEEYLAIEVALDEAVGTRIELFAVARRFDAERIEVGVEVAAHPVGADQHQRAHGIAGRLMQVGRGDLGASGLAFGLRLGRKLGANHLFDFGPVAVERGRQLVLRRQRPVVAAPGRALGVLLDVGWTVFQALEELLPLGVERGRVLFVAGVDIVDVGGVGALQERRKGKGGIRVLTRHNGVLVISTSRAENGANADPG